MYKTLTSHAVFHKIVAFLCIDIFTILDMNLGEDKRVRVWDLAAGMTLVELKGHMDTVVGLSWSRNSECLASCGLDGAVRVWNIRSHSSSLSR
jgi:WD40 repeat protein